jgi:GTP pyrophosphokinase
MITQKKERKPPCFELFHAPLAVVFDPNTLELVETAYIFSKFGHADQLRDDGTRYFDHPKTACWIYVHEFGGRDSRIIVLLHLHDIQEDQRMLSTYRIALNFGADSALDVRALTKIKKGKETIQEYLQRIIDQGAWAITGKLFDRLHNLRTLGGCTRQKRAKQIAETKKVLMPILIPALRACGEEWIEWADALEMKMNEAIASYQR